MDSELWISVILSIPVAIAADILSPKVQEWLDSRKKKKYLEKQQQEKLSTHKEKRENHEMEAKSETICINMKEEIRIQKRLKY